ncbi:NapC/NirT family cytochrome c [Escherichia coli]|nr:NapC/NirT family cytochrome c [Escherichia coli]
MWLVSAGNRLWAALTHGMEISPIPKSSAISCHEMRKHGVSRNTWIPCTYNNRSGVRATCPDCHVPHEFVAEDDYAAQSK